MKKMMQISLVVLASVVLAACSGGGTTSAPAEEKTLTAMESGCTGTTYCYSPATIDATSGAAVTIHFKNPNAQAHSLVLKDVAGATRLEVAASKDGDLKFTAPKAGTYEFTCDIPGHADLGMKGVLTVK